MRNVFETEKRFNLFDKRFPKKIIARKDDAFPFLVCPNTPAGKILVMKFGIFGVFRLYCFPQFGVRLLRMVENTQKIMPRVSHT